MTAQDFILDEARDRRIGISEAVYCAGKSPLQIARILEHAEARGRPLLLTRLAEEKLLALPPDLQSALDWDPVSHTAYLGDVTGPQEPPRVAIVTAGTSDIPVAREAMRTLHFEGQAAIEIADVGVAGLWRLLRRADEIRCLPVVIVAAGMDAALPSVVGGLVSGAVIAVPTSVGYGVAEGGRAALDSMLSSCAPGIAVVNIDNGYGAACAAIRALGAAIAKTENSAWNAAIS